MKFQVTANFDPFYLYLHLILHLFAFVLPVKWASQSCTTDHHIMAPSHLKECLFTLRQVPMNRRVKTRAVMVL